MGILSLRFLTKLLSVCLIFRFNSPILLKIDKLCGIVIFIYHLSTEQLVLILLPLLLRINGVIPQKPANFIIFR